VISLIAEKRMSSIKEQYIINVLSGKTNKFRVETDKNTGENANDLQGTRCLLSLTGRRLSAIIFAFCALYPFPMAL
jgi:hypothetical protein